MEKRNRAEIAEILEKINTVYENKQILDFLVYDYFHPDTIYQVLTDTQKILAKKIKKKDYDEWDRDDEDEEDDEWDGWYDDDDEDDEENEYFDDYEDDEDLEEKPIPQRNTDTERAKQKSANHLIPQRLHHFTNNINII